MKKLLIALLFFVSFAHAQNVQWYKQSDTTAAPLGNLYVAGKGFVGGLLEPDSIVTPSLSAGYVPYYSGRLRDSPIYTNGTNVGIGTTAPAASLDIGGNGKIWIRQGSGGGLIPSAGAGLKIESDPTGGNLQGYDYGTSAPLDLSLNANGGNVGIGTVAPSATLDIAASVGSRYLEWHGPTGGLAGSIGQTGTDGSYLQISANGNTTQIAANQESYIMGGNVGIRTTAATSTLDDAGSFATNIVSPTGNYIATSTDNVIYQSALSLADTVFLPTAAGISGRWYNIMKSDASVNVVTVKASGSELINGANTYALSTQYKFVRIQSNGTQWFIWGSN